MMRMLLILLFTLFSASAHSTEGPDETVLGYLTAMNSYDFTKAVEYFAESDCVQFKRMMIPLLQMEASAGKTDLSTMLFGSPLDMQQVGALHPCVFVGKAISSMTSASKAMSMPITNQTMKVLGGVKESDNLVHYIVRSSAKIGDNEVSSLEVVSARQEAGIWHIQMSEKLKGISAAITRAVQQQQRAASAGSAQTKKTASRRKQAQSPQ